MTHPIDMFVPAREPAFLGSAISCAKGVVLPGDFMTAGQTNPLPKSAPSDLKKDIDKAIYAKFLPWVIGAAVVGGVAYVAWKGGALKSVVANPGRAQKLGVRPSDVDPKELARGTKHELEHTDSRKVAQRIALDHLAEDEAYYEKLDAMERGTFRNNAAVVVAPTGEAHRVKNLGWLLRHWKDVSHFEVSRTGELLRKMQDVVLRAHMRDGSVYYTPFASRTVLACWLNRPVFQGVRVVWLGQERVAGKELCRAEGVR